MKKKTQLKVKNGKVVGKVPGYTETSRLHKTRKRLAATLVQDEEDLDP